MAIIANNDNCSGCFGGVNDKKQCGLESKSADVGNFISYLREIDTFVA